MQKKRNTAIFIDGENIPAKKATIIMSEAKKRGVIDSAKVYGLQRDMATRQWSKIAKSMDIMKDIRLCGGPSKNKVDLMFGFEGNKDKDKVLDPEEINCMMDMILESTLQLDNEVRKEKMLVILNVLIVLVKSMN